jgi:hypothetical protein
MDPRLVTALLSLLAALTALVGALTVVVVERTL